MIGMIVGRPTMSGGDIYKKRISGREVFLYYIKNTYILPPVVVGRV